jgi:hypothetical protein
MRNDKRYDTKNGQKRDNFRYISDILEKFFNLTKTKKILIMLKKKKFLTFAIFKLFQINKILSSY